MGLSSSDCSGTDDPDFQELVDLYYAMLYRFAYSLSQCEATASDLTQETFYIWARKGHQLEDATKAKAWLFTTLRREFLKARRAHRDRPHVNLESADADLPEVEPDVVRQSSVAEVLRAFATLENHYRAPLTLFHLEGFTCKEIAAILHLPIGTVLAQISRGRQKVVQLLQETTTQPQESNVIPLRRRTQQK